MKKSYLDFYLLPVPKKNLERYKKVATRFGKMAREYGALEYRESVGDDLSPKKVISFKKAAKPGKNDVVIAAVVAFKSRAHRDQVMQKMFKDPRMDEMMKEGPIADMKKMYYGGFETIVDV